MQQNTFDLLAKFSTLCFRRLGVRSRACKILMSTYACLDQCSCIFSYVNLLHYATCNIYHSFRPPIASPRSCYVEKGVTTARSLSAFLACVAETAGKHLRAVCCEFKLSIRETDLCLWFVRLIRPVETLICFAFVSERSGN